MAEEWATLVALIKEWTPDEYRREATSSPRSTVTTPTTPANVIDFRAWRLARRREEG